MQELVSSVSDDPTAIAVIGLAIIAAIILFFSFINRISALLLPVVRSRVYTAALALLLILWLIGPTLGLAIPRAGILGILAALFIVRLALELAAPRRGLQRRDWENPKDSPYGMPGDSSHPSDSGGHGGGHD